MMKRILTFPLISLLLLIAFIAVPGLKTQASPDYFTIAVIPDTQYYSRGFPAIFDQQTQWIADNARSQNIVFAAHLGDLVNDYDSGVEWQNAVHSMGIIRNAGLPYSVVPGNHDLDGPAGMTTTFDSYFPYTDFTGYAWYGGHYPAQSNSSSYELISSLGQNLIILNLVCSPALLRDAEPWANEVLTRYSAYKAIVVTHGYIDTDGNYIDSGRVSGIEIWNKIVELHSNVIAVLCGHYHGQFYSTATGTSGNTINNLLTDYQNEAHGGNGWLRLYKFYPQLNKISAVTYSPYLNQSDTSRYGQFDIPVELQDTTINPPFWDTNGDHVCDVGDVVVVGLLWGQTGAPGWTPEDVNHDGVIDIGDIVLLGLHWNEAW